MKLKNSRNLDARQSVLVDSAFYAVRPPGARGRAPQAAPAAARVHAPPACSSASRAPRSSRRASSRLCKAELLCTSWIWPCRLMHLQSRCCPLHLASFGTRHVLRCSLDARSSSEHRLAGADAAQLQCLHVMRPREVGLATATAHGYTVEVNDQSRLLKHALTHAQVVRKLRRLPWAANEAYLVRCLMRRGARARQRGAAGGQPGRGAGALPPLAGRRARRTPCWRRRGCCPRVGS